MHETPNRTIIDTHATISQFGNKTSQGKIRSRPLKKPIAISSRKDRRLVTTNPFRRHTACRVRPLQPMNSRADRYAETLGRFMTRQAFFIDRKNNAFTQIH